MKITAGLSEGQVLQRLGKRGADVLIAGEGAQGGPIEIEIRQGSKLITGWTAKPAKAKAGEFKVALSGIPTGGPYRMEVRQGKARCGVKMFFVGDVWLMAGQSNMEGVGNMEGAPEPHPLVRAFSMRHEWREGRDPLHVLGESPDICHNGGLQLSVALAEERRQKTHKGVGVGLFFAKDMLARTGVPQGLIATAHGGTSMKQWSPDLQKEGGASLYYSMRKSVEATGQPVAGLLWYQGESDCNEAESQVYTAAMKKLVAAVRRDLRQPNLPWVTVQLSRHVITGDGRWWNSIREQQRKLPEVISHLETVPAVDLPLDDGIHIGTDGYDELGMRMASAASRLVHGTKEMRPPQLKKVHRPTKNACGYCVDVEFSEVEGDLMAFGRPLGFSIVNGENLTVPRIFRTSLHGLTVRLHLSPESLDGLSIGYGLGHDPACNIVDERGTSLPAFGPVEVMKKRALLPYVTQWRKTGILPAAQRLDRLKCLAVSKKEHVVKSYDPTTGFINENAEWKGRSGQVFFSAVISLPEAMKLRALMGYDGPFRLWIDRKPFFQDIHGTNPCVPDDQAKAVSLRKGAHELTVAMDLNDGCAWGFFLRFERVDVPAEDIRTGAYAKPVYSV